MACTLWTWWGWVLCASDRTLWIPFLLLHHIDWNPYLTVSSKIPWNQRKHVSCPLHWACPTCHPNRQVEYGSSCFLRWWILYFPCSCAFRRWRRNSILEKTSSLSKTYSRSSFQTQIEHRPTNHSILVSEILSSVIDHSFSYLLTSPSSKQPPGLSSLKILVNPSMYCCSVRPIMRNRMWI